MPNSLSPSKEEINRTISGFAQNKTRDQINSDKELAALRSMAQSFESHVKRTEHQAQISAEKSAAAEKRAKSAEVRGWISTCISFLAFIVSIVALLK